MIFKLAEAAERNWSRKQSGVVSAERRVGMTPTMPPATDRGNGLAEMEDQGPARAPERATAARTGFRPSSHVNLKFAA